MESAGPIIGAVAIGGIISLATQWLISRRSERLERAKWQQEEAKERRQAVRHYRERRVQPIIEALDKAIARWDWESLIELADATGYSGEKVENDVEKSKQRQHEARKKLFEEVKRDISAARTIPDHELRQLVVKALWRSIDRDTYDEKLSHDLGEAYQRLENWMFGR